MAALKLLDDAHPAIPLVRIGRKEKGQRIVVFGSATGGPRCQRRRGERAGAPQQASPSERLIEHGASDLALVPDVLGTRSAWRVAGVANAAAPELRDAGGRHHR